MFKDYKERGKGFKEAVKRIGDRPAEGQGKIRLYPVESSVLALVGLWHRDGVHAHHQPFSRGTDFKIPPFLKRQAIYAGIGLFLMIAMMFFSYSLSETDRLSDPWTVRASLIAVLIPGSATGRVSDAMAAKD